MNAARRAITSARTYLGKMTASQKLLVGSTGVIAAMALFLVAQYTARPDMVDLFLTGDAAVQQTTLDALRQANIPAELKGSKVVVPAEYRSIAVSQLAEAGALPNDTTLLFANLLDRQGFYYSKQQNDQAFLIALQNELSRTIRGFSNVRDATVILDIPEPRGIGAAVRQPTASATVFTRSGSPLTQSEVDAIAELIAGARAGLTLENIRVIDGSARKQRRPTNPDDVLPTTYLEHAAAVEEQLQRKLSDLLGYIGGATIAVTAQVDVTRVNQQSVKYFSPDEGGSAVVPKRTNSSSTTQGRSERSAEPGVRSNAQGDILSSGGAGSATTLSEEQSEKEFETAIGSETTTTHDPRGMPTLLAASINIPRSYVAEQLAAAAGEGAAAPTEAEIAARFEIERQRIEESVKPHLVTVSGAGRVEGAVVVSMISADVPAPAPGEARAGLWGGLAAGGGGGALGGGLIEKGLLALLAAGAMGMMLLMVRKATRPVALPTPQELSGVPRTLPTVNDMVGEADESEAPMTGIEVGDEEVRARMLVEQVGELVGTNPDGAANLLGRWITEEH
ncbi:MAG TPA: flagellar M-ring protein FliF C-terminal domain-containing protein [Phycisphaerales bacterium]|nr:flagellar M-ring protein FliF C-terminal domain-containing protein [Phycisphaerales bacterium]